MAIPQSKGLQRAFPLAKTALTGGKRPEKRFAWRDPLLAALRLSPSISHACKVAGISRNSMYAHLHRYPRFRRQLELARDRGWEQRYRDNLKQLELDPRFQRAMRRAKEALHWMRERQRGVTD